MTRMIYPELPSYVAPDLWLDADNCVEFIRWKDEVDPYQLLWWHKAQGGERGSGGWCFGGCVWRNPDPSVIHYTTFWDLISLHPLTLAPSLLCLTCGAHGYIENDRWRKS